LHRKTVFKCSIHKVPRSDDSILNDLNALHRSLVVHGADHCMVHVVPRLPAYAAYTDSMHSIPSLVLRSVLNA
jgi:hypothetical protein